MRGAAAVLLALLAVLRGAQPSWSPYVLHTEKGPLMVKIREMNTLVETLHFPQSCVLGRKLARPGGFAGCSKLVARRRPMGGTGWLVGLGRGAGVSLMDASCTRVRVGAV